MEVIYIRDDVIIVVFSFILKMINIIIVTYFPK